MAKSPEQHARGDLAHEDQGEIGSDISVDGVTLRALVFDGVRAEELVDDTSLNKRTYG